MNGCSCRLWVLWCALRWENLLKVFWQMPHWWGRTPMCIQCCRTKSDTQVKLRLQQGHRMRWWPECRRWCTVRKIWLEKVSRHSLHVYIIFPVDSEHLAGPGSCHTVPQSLLGACGWEDGHRVGLGHSFSFEGWQVPLAAQLWGWDVEH